MSFLTTGVQEILEALDASLLEAVQQASCMYCYHAWLSQSLWSDGTPDAVSHSLGQVSGAADQDGEDLFSGTDWFNNVEENGYLRGISRPSDLPFIFLIPISYVTFYLISFGDEMTP